jgi:hypothetical protein
MDEHHHGSIRHRGNGACRHSTPHPAPYAASTCLGGGRRNHEEAFPATLCHSIQVNTRKEPKTKAQTRLQYVTGEMFWEDMAQIMTSLVSRERMMETCGTFVELISVDKKLKMDDEEDDLNEDGATTPGTRMTTMGMRPIHPVGVAGSARQQQPR